MSGKLRAEGWTDPRSGTFTKKFFSIPMEPGASGRRELSRWHDCRLGVSASWDGVTSLLTGTLIRILDGDTWVDDFLAERMPRHLRQGGSLVVSGRQIAGATEDIPVYPPDYGVNNPSKRPNWVWAGENIAGPLPLADLGSIREEWTLYLSGERYELDVSLATSGNYTLTVGGNTTSAIDWDATASEIQSALEALTGVTEVSVLQEDEDTREFVIVFEDPKDLGSDMTLDDSGISNLGDLTKLNDGFDTSADPTFTVTVDGDTTEALDWDVSASSLEGVSETLTPPGTGLQGLTTVNDVKVSGSGTASDPWTMVFFDPPVISSVSASFSGTEVLVNTVAGSADPSPWTKSQSIDQKVDPTIHGEYDDPAIEVVTDNLDTDADWALLVNATGRFAGAQRVLSVIPGEIYQAKVRVKPTVAGTYVLVIRDAAENLIAQTSPRDVPLSAGSYQDLTISDVVIPAGVDRVIFRVAVTSVAASTHADFYVNGQHAEFVLGLAASTPGDFVETLLDHAQARDDGAWLELTADATNDTGSTAWPDTFAYQADGFAMTLGDVLKDMRDRFGVEWSVTPKATPSAGVTHELNLWVSGGAGTDKSATGPTLWVSGSIVDGEIVERIPAFTRLVGWGRDDLFVADTNTSTSAVYGTITKILDVEELGDEDSIQEAIDTAFADEEDNRKTGKVTLKGGSVVPFVHFGLGDLLVCQAQPALEKTTRRIVAVSWQHGKPTATYEVDV